MQYVIDIYIRWTHYDRWSAHNLINNNICNYLLLSLVINTKADDAMDNEDDSIITEGVDDELPLEEAPLVVASVSCEPIECPLNGEKLVEFHRRIEPLSMNINFDQLGLKYAEALTVIYDIYSMTF